MHRIRRGICILLLGIGCILGMGCSAKEEELETIDISAEENMEEQISEADGIYVHVCG